MTTTLPLPARFQTMRWSSTRKAIHALAIGQSIVFPREEYFNAATSVKRLNEAYEGQQVWKITGGKPRPTVTRLK
jgi:hypothetical protein